MGDRMRYRGRKFSARILFRATAVALVAATLAAGSSPSRSLTVATSRGDSRLLVYAPTAAASDSKPIVLLISGEGGWRSFDVLLASFLVKAGYWVGGVDAMKYFWRAQDDREALASDFRAYSRALAMAAGRSSDAPVVLMGYSFGADLAPWLAGAGGWGSRICGLVMIGPDQVGSLEFRLSEILGFEAKDHIFQVADALRSASGIPTLFIHGEADPHSAAPALCGVAGEPKKLIVVPKADHHFSHHETELRERLLGGMAWLLGSLERPPSKAKP